MWGSPCRSGGRPQLCLGVTQRLGNPAAGCPNSLERAGVTAAAVGSQVKPSAVTACRGHAQAPGVCGSALEGLPMSPCLLTPTV